MNSKKDSKFIPFGKTVRPHGIKGELKLFIYNKDSQILKQKINIWIDKEGCLTLFKLLSIRGNEFKIVKLDKINSRNDARSLSNKEFFISREDFPDIESDNFYINDIINFKVLDGGNELGFIYDIFSLPGGNVMGINCDGKEILVPMVEKYIKFFDFENRIVILKNIKEFIEL